MDEKTSEVVAALRRAASTSTPVQLIELLWQLLGLEGRPIRVATLTSYFSDAFPRIGLQDLYRTIRWHRMSPQLPNAMSDEQVNALLAPGIRDQLTIDMKASSAPSPGELTSRKDE